MLTALQWALLERLEAHPRTTRKLVDLGPVSRGGWLKWRADAIGHAMRRLEDRELVRRAESNPIVWELTKSGRSSMAIRREANE